MDKTRKPVLEINIFWEIWLYLGDILNELEVLTNKKMRTLTEIKNQLSNYKAHLFENYPLKSIAIFGSYVRDDANEDSDLDLFGRI